jgi:CarD family transcriptional regulator
MLYNIGDKIVYPMHGAGIIEAIEEKEVFGKKQNYYVMKMPIGGMKVMIPMTNVDEIGIRQVMDKKEVERVYDVFRENKTLMSNNWNKRYRENLSRIKSGDIFEVADVVKNLMIREKEKGLSTGEKKMLNNAKQILVSELILIQDAAQDEIESILKDSFENA